MPTKADLRRRFRATRGAFPSAQADADSKSICRRVLELPELIHADSVMVYASTAREVQTAVLIETLLSQGKTVAVPRITDAQAGSMDAVPIGSLSDLIPGEYGIPTPRNRAPLDEPAEVIVVPGLAFSPITGTRLGMGGGFYDRYFAALNRTAFRVGLAFDHQCCDDLPAEPHDLPMHALALPGHLVRIDTLVP